MNFGLSEEQELLQESVRTFVAGECPVASLRAFFDGDADHDADLWRGIAELGLAGLLVPEAYGGAGMEVLELALVAEALGEGAVPSPFLGHSLATLALALGGSEEQKRAWLPRLAAGSAIGSVALCEESGDWEPGAFRARASDGRVAGAKVFVEAASRADLVVVGVAGGGLVLVESGAPGANTTPIDTLDRTRRLHRLDLDGAPCDALPGGAAAAPRVRDAGLLLLAADAFGAATRLIQMTIEYTKVREQFDTPLAQFQSVKHQIANMATDAELCRGLLWYAAHAFDHIEGDAERSAALAKAHITDRAMQVARDAVELHGGIGFTWECDVHMWFKRTMFDRAFLGTPAVHRERNARLAGWSAS